MEYKIVQDNGLDQESLQGILGNLRVSINESGKNASISFKMKMHSEFHYCLMYMVSEQAFQNGVSLEDFVERQTKPNIIDWQANPGAFHVLLKKEEIRCMLYVARRVKDTYEIVNQWKPVTTEPLRLLPTIGYKVKYEPIRGGLFARTNKQRAIIGLKGDLPIPDGYLTYRCIGEGREQKVFGLDLSSVQWLKSLACIEVVISKNEKIIIESSGNHKYILEKVNS